MADEIECASVVAFHAALGRAHGLHLYGNAVNPGDSVTLGGITVVYRPPPSRDAAREAFEEWAKGNGHLSIGRLGADWWTPYEETARLTRDVAYAVFLAGRASVKP